MKLTALIIMIIVFTIFIFCSDRNETSTNRVDQGLVENDAINEASGIDVSLLNSDILWTHNDSGDISRIFAMDKTGRNLGTFMLDGITARDWEDISVGPGPVEGKSYIYVADIGDNRAEYEDKYIYRLEEPKIDMQKSPVDSTIENIDVILFQFPDGARDAETLMVDPVTKDLIVVSKREDNVNVYRLVYPQKTDGTLTAEKIATIPHTQICGGDISNSGSKIIIKNYDDIFFWHRSSGQSIEESMSAPAEILDYVPEPQGEAVCWSSDEKGYFTISEEAEEIPAHLYYYPFQ
jgi:hypothetical protein